MYKLCKNQIIIDRFWKSDLEEMEVSSVYDISVKRSLAESIKRMKIRSCKAVKKNGGLYLIRTAIGD